MEQRDQIIVGADEVGLGCLFGPLVIAATANVNRWHDDRVTDSKRVKSEKRRNDIAAAVRENMMWQCVSVPASVINEHGVRHAIDEGYRLVLDAILARLAGHRVAIMLDGNENLAISQRYDSFDTQTYFMPKADLKVFECGAASLVAKVHRDNWVHRIVKEHPTLAVYGLDGNKGYTSDDHTRALFQHGLTQWHRTQYCNTLMTNYLEKKRAARSAAAV